jgi:hypothetical protein
MTIEVNCVTVNPFGDLLRNCWKFMKILLFFNIEYFQAASISFLERLIVEFAESSENAKLMNSRGRFY